jgi:hypothetical protein
MIRSTACFEARCDECDAGFGGFEDENVTVHYPDAEKLERDLKANDWSIVGTRVLCPACQAHIACSLIGHDWQPWRPLTHLSLPGQMRSCNHCSTAEFDPPIQPLPDEPASHRTP